MTKRLQNKIAESRLTLPVAVVYAIAIWIANGLLSGQLWIQFACFAVSTYLMVEINNSNALIRIYSRMVSCAFLFISVASCFLFTSIYGCIAELCVIASLTTLFHSYQDRRAMVWIFYSFLFISIASLFFPHILYYVPGVWLIMAFFLRSISWRSFWASVIGLVLPYWFAAIYLIYTQNFDSFTAHFTQLAVFHPLADYTVLTTHQIITFLFVFIVSITGIVHYHRNSFNDKIRIRMFYDCFTTINLMSLAFIILQPQHYELLMRIMIITASPLIAHFIALTRTWITNIAFYVILIAVLLLTGYNLWMP